MNKEYVCPKITATDVGIIDMICLSSIVDSGGQYGEYNEYIEGEISGNWYFGEPD